MSIFKGSGVALATPMKENGEINFDSMEKLIEAQIAGGTDALIVCGTSGEAPTLDDDEHLFGYVRALNGKELLFAGNFSGEEIRLPKKRLPGELKDLLLSVYGEIRTEGEDIVFRPYEAWVAVCL